MIKVLIIEDDALLIRLYASELKKAGYESTPVLNGQEGLLKILEGGWALILLDIMLPQMDGITILTQLKSKSPKVANGPIVVMTNLDSKETAAKALGLGAIEYIEKDQITPRELAEKVKIWLK